MRLKLIISYFLLAILLCTGATVRAQDRSDGEALRKALAQQQADQDAAVAAIAANPPGAFFNRLNSVAKEMAKQNAQSLSGGLFNAGLEISLKTTKWAAGLAGSLLLAYLISETINYMHSKNNSLAGTLFDVALPASFCAYLITNYAELILLLAAPGNVTPSLLDYIRNIGGDPIAGIMQMYGSILGMVGTAIAQSFSTLGAALAKFSFSAAFIGIADTAATVLLALVMIYVIISGVAEIIGLVLMGPFLGAVAVAFGPIFIAGFATPWTREYFSKWLGFLIASAVLSGVLGVCISIATKLFASFGFSNIAGDVTPSAVSLLIALVVVMAINSLIKQAPSIATALVPGGFGASKGSGGEMSNAVKSAGEKGAAIKKDFDNIRSAAKAKMDGAKNGASSAPSSSVSPLDASLSANGPSRYPTISIN